jgi:Mrp family chromosome partitioning ATPase
VVLSGAAPLRTAAVATDAALDIYPVVTRYPAAHQLLSRPELADVLKQLEASYRWVICDTAPALLVPDVQIIAPHVGACLAVVRAGRTPRSALRDLAERLPREKTLGFFLNDARAPRHARRYYRSPYYTTDADSADDTP